MTTKKDDDTEALLSGAAPEGSIEINQEQSQTDNTPMSTNQQLPSWSFGVIRIIRVLVGVAVLTALLMNYNGLTERVMTNPELGLLAFAAITQFIQVEDIEKVKSIIGR